MTEYLPTNIANGQLPLSKATLYTVPTGSSAIIRSVVLVNTTGGTVTVNLYVNFGTGSRRFVPLDLTLSAGVKFDDNSAITIPAGAVIEGDASASNAVDFIISGVLATP